MLLSAAASGDADASRKLYEAVYEELHMLARSRMASERSDHTLQATALVNETCLRLLGRTGVEFQNRRHFYKSAADAMRRVLIDHARSRNAEKRGGGRRALSITCVADLAEDADPATLLALDGVILRLERIDAQCAEVVRLRFYAGLDDKAVAEAMDISERTVRREWMFARGWLRDALRRED